MLSRSKAKSLKKQRQMLAIISRHQNSFVINGAVASLDNRVYSVISRQLNNGMSATAVYEFITQNKVALSKYAEWGVNDDESKENEAPLSSSITSLNKELRLEDEMKFMENFDPEKSKREQRKLNRKFSNLSTRKTSYDDRGIHVKTGLDICDCLNDQCEGCFFACAKCRSLKCGHECRLNRRWMYESHTIQGMDEMIQNQYLDH